MRNQLSAFIFALCMITTTGKSTELTVMPSKIIGSWCGVVTEGSRIDITKGGYEEGDGTCAVNSVSSSRSEGILTYNVKLNCDPGVEGKKGSSVYNERFSVLRNERIDILYRQGSLYESNLKLLYRKCKG